MSYILDALRRADAERERGRVPGLHTQLAPLRAKGRSAPQRPLGARAPLIAGLSLIAAVVAGLAWWALRGDSPAPVATSEPTPTLTAPPSSPAAAPSRPAFQPEPPLAPPPRIAGAAAPSPASPATAPVPPILAPAPPPPAPAPVPAPAARPPAAAAPAPQPAARAPAASAAPTDESRLPRVNELGATARAALPPLKISGSTYAANPAMRMLILDGQVVQEGQDIAPGLKLESIGPRGAILVHQGQRLRLSY